MRSFNFSVYRYVKDWAQCVNEMFGTKISIEDTVVSTSPFVTTELPLYDISMAPLIPLGTR